MSESTQPTSPSTAEIKLRPIQELLGMNFYIPKYQRGYRWTPRQVKDLLDDIWEFLKREPSESEFYCLQPLVVKEKRQDTFRKIKDEAQNLDEVKRLLKGSWEVIDGQQRLTTIKIVLAYLDIELPKEDKSILESNSYSIEYETRTADNDSCGIGSEDFLDKIAEYADDIEKNRKIAESNIDFFHMRQAYTTIEEWFKLEDRQVRRVDFKNTLLKNVQVIWYDAEGEDPIEVFTRLNIGKISLTNAELIKALFLKRSNWQGKTSDSLSLSQLEIASQWDNIEYTLQNDEFWMFFHDEDAPPTRIDYIFDYICNKNLLYDSPNDVHNSAEKIGSDSYRTFRYFYNYFYPKDSIDQTGQNILYDKIKTCWDRVKEVFGTLLEWYNDCELYHYIGFLTKIHEERNRSDYAANLLTEWAATQSKDDFLKFLKIKIKDTLNECNYLTKTYDIRSQDAKEARTAKSQCRPLLLLFNVQSVINQNKGYKESQQYRLGVFYKFPFHLYKKTEWDIEHIDSNTENQLDDANSQKEWVLSALYALYCNSGKEPVRQETSQTPNSQTQADDGNIDIIGRLIFEDQQRAQINAIDEFLSASSPKNEPFKKIKEMLVKLLEGQSSDWKDDKKESSEWGSNEKNQVWNFALLDQTTNREYHNDIFPTKRRKLIAKDQGKIISLEWKDHSVVVTTDDAEIAFVPPCTKNAFLKYYTPGNNDIWKWNRRDAENYRQTISDTLQEFDITLNKTDKNQGNR